MTPEEKESSMCLATGVFGIHSDDFYNPEGGRCMWCGLVSCADEEEEPNKIAPKD